MPDERRYQDDEIREIFGRAAGAEEQSETTPSSGHGLTLTELQEIGREVGLEPGRVAQAAEQLDRSGLAGVRRTSMGVPISVGRSVDLPRGPTDHEWEVLVSEIRRTFNARGRISAHGSLREWTNGNLHIYVETTEDGPRLRMRTVKGSAVAATRLGFGAIAFSLVMLVVLVLTGQLADDLGMPLLFAAMGVGALASNMLTLPRWAREREDQMAHIAERALGLLQAPADE